MKSILTLLPLGGILVTIELASATTTCTERLDFLGCEDGRFWIWSRTGGDCVGSLLWEFYAQGDSVTSRLIHDWTGDSTEVLGEDFQYRAFCGYREAVARELHFPELGFTIQAPDSVTATSERLREQRPPTLL